MRDVLGCIYTDEQFAALFPKEGQPAEAPWRLALVTVLQFVENLSDQQAADAVRGRIDWKYLLSLDLTDAGFDASVLCEFRSRVVEHHAEQLLLETMLTLFQQKHTVNGNGSNDTVPGVKIRVLLWVERHVLPLPKKLDSKEGDCSTLCLTQLLPTGSVRFHL